MRESGGGKEGKYFKIHFRLRIVILLQDGKQQFLKDFCFLNNFDQFYVNMRLSTFKKSSFFKTFLIRELEFDSFMIIVNTTLSIDHFKCFKTILLIICLSVC